MNKKEKDLLERELKKKGYDGLYNPDVGGEPCGCDIEYLTPCDSQHENCIGGFKHKDGMMYADVEELP